MAPVFLVLDDDKSKSIVYYAVLSTDEKTKHETVKIK